MASLSTKCTFPSIGRKAEHFDGFVQSEVAVPPLLGIVPVHDGGKAGSHRRAKSAVSGLRKQIQRVRAFIQPRKSVTPRNFVDETESSEDFDDISINSLNLSFESDDEDVDVKTAPPKYSEPTPPSVQKPPRTFVRYRLRTATFDRELPVSS
eukprot:TRINITY_DN63791_c0_g1_i1.p2 TRINITY_DN63791_c0_g1~~TRINITY_DN63791_c0_g1_i1.p2  ORF type:complete len:169 (+),score=18.31 TRINITY_DN63791_c0_g1_i1:54-509(+)